MIPNSPVQDKPFTALMKRFGSASFVRTFLRQPSGLEADPHLLLLLADQELIDGREAQAGCLVEAAYEVFDRRNKTGVYQPR